MTQLALSPEPLAPARSLSPLVEMGAYEALWLQPGTTFPRLAELFRRHEDALPSHFIEPEVAQEAARATLESLHRAGISSFGLRVHGAGEYPAKLRDARNPVELLYYRGWWSLVESPCVAVVGTRKPSSEGLRRARSLTKKLSAEGWTIVSGLAAGIDTAVHRTALATGGRTIAVVGTALTSVYPRENQELQAVLEVNGGYRRAEEDSPTSALKAAEPGPGPAPPIQRPLLHVSNLLSTLRKSTRFPD